MTQMGSFLKIISGEEFGFKKAEIFVKDEGEKAHSDQLYALISEYFKIYKPLQPLLIVFKQFLYYARLNEPLSVHLKGRHVSLLSHALSGLLLPAQAFLFPGAALERSAAPSGPASLRSSAVLQLGEDLSLGNESNEAEPAHREKSH